MPVTKQAIKKVRQDRRKSVFNLRAKKVFKQALQNFRKNPTSKGLGEVFSKLDRAAKVNVIHKNTASRLKGRLSKLVKESAATDKKETAKRKSTSKKSAK